MGDIPVPIPSQGCGGSRVGAGVSAPRFFLPAAYPTAYAPISQAFPQQAPIIPQQQREGEALWGGTPPRGWWLLAPPTPG